MADEMAVGSGSIKRRDPWGTFLLSFVTLGIYKFVWYYMINREIRDHSGDRIKVDPVLSLLAVTIGWLLIVPPFVSLYRTADRIRQVQQSVGARKTINPWIALLIGLISWPGSIAFYLPYAQSHINSAWDVEFERAQA